MLEVVFWLLLFGTAFSYFIYPLVLLLVQVVHTRPEKIDRDQIPKSVTLIITAYNEEKRIQEKIDNCYELTDNGFELEIIIASDCSTDKTDSIVNASDNIRLVRAAERLGKENAQLAAINEAKGEIIVFSDVATKLPSDAIEKLVKYFADPKVGAISSVDKFISQDGSVAGEGVYVSYEMWLRQQESKLSGLVGLSGSFFAARKQICTHWDINSPSDFNTALNCVRNDMVAINAPDVLGYYSDLKDSSKEYARKLRTVIRGMTALARHPDVLNPFKYGFFSVQVFSHKVMRWLVPWFMLLLFAVNLMCLSYGTVYQFIMVGQVLFYGAALLAHFVHSVRSFSLFKIIYFFVLVNIALFDASCHFLRGKRMTVWEPSAR